jgi:putative transposase
MTYNPEIHHRRSIRLRNYDYSQAGAYFVTVCSWGKECVFGEITNGEMHLNECGEIVMKYWHGIQDHFTHVGTDEFIVMPNHSHGIINIVGAIHELPLHREQNHEHIKNRRKMVLPKIIGWFKMNSAKQINQIRKTPGTPVWQRNYYEHIIRDEKQLHSIREYIRYNPLKWDEDEENPEMKGIIQRNA